MVLSTEPDPDGTALVVNCGTAGGHTLTTAGQLSATLDQVRDANSAADQALLAAVAFQRAADPDAPGAQDG